MFDKTKEMLTERFFDDALTETERALFDRLVASDPALKRRLEVDAKVRSLFSEASELKFAPSFAGDVVRDAEEESALSTFLSKHHAKGFSAGFSRHVIDAIDLEQSEAGHFFNSEVNEYLDRLFPRLATPAAAAALLAMAINFNSAVAGAPVFEALLGLPSVDSAEFSFLVVGSV